MENLNDNEKQKILLEYLRDFAIYFSDEEEDLFQERFKDFTNLLIRADDYNTLKKAICYILLSQNKKVKYIYLKSNDVIDIMLNEAIEDENKWNFTDLQKIPLLIIYHPKIWKKNKILWETLNYLQQIRGVEDKKTIIISDSTRLYDEHGSLDLSNTVVNLSRNLDIPTTTYTPMANFVGTSGGNSGLYD